MRGNLFWDILAKLQDNMKINWMALENVRIYWDSDETGLD